MIFIKKNPTEDWILQYVNILQKCLHDNMLKEIPAPILLMVGPTLNAKGN